MTIKFGIMQGRLTKTRRDILQKFPDNWKKEFKYLKKTNLDYLEFFTEQKKNKKNPIWTASGIEEIKKKISKINYKKLILCDNFTVENLITEKKTEKYLFNLIDRLSLFKNSKLIIPIIYKNSFTKNNFNKHLASIDKLINYSNKKKVRISFEIDANIKIIRKFCGKFSKNKNFYITFDTGNAFLLNKNFYKDIQAVKSYIDHIHFKDRDVFGNNVVLGEGKINFRTILKKLNKPNRYNGTVTFETNRGIDPIHTANSNLKIIKNFLI